MKKITKIISASMLALTFSANAQNPVLLKDVNSQLSGGSYTQPSDGAAIGTTYYFAGYSANGGGELWKTDGTSAGTMLVKDIRPGGESSDPYYFVTVGSTIYFIADDGTNGEEVWKSDGTAAGTKIVIDPYLGDDNSSSPDYLTVVGTDLYWRAYDENIDEDVIFKADASGNISIVINPDNNANNYKGPFSPNNFAAVGNTLYFQAYSYDNNWNNPTGWELWKTDGTEAGTALVKDIYPGWWNNSNPDHLTAVGSTLFFMAQDQFAGYELFKTDGTAVGTVLVSDMNPGGGSSWDAQEFVAVGSNLMFRNWDGVHGRELWKSDGTLAGTGMVSDIYPGGSWSNPQYFTVIGSTLYFAAENTIDYGLFKSDGTSAGTLVVSNQCYLDGPIIAAGSTLYFNGSDNNGNSSNELWKSDGTSAGTTLVRDIYTGNFNDSYPDYFGVAGSLVYFQAHEPTYGYEMYTSDGTSAGTYVLQLGKGLTQDANVDNLTKVGNNFFFTADDGIHGSELWMSDGTATGSVLVKDIFPGGGSQSYYNLTAVGSNLLFCTYDVVSGNNVIWKSDGSSAGTIVVSAQPINPTVSNYAVMGGNIYFSANYGAAGYELWKSDGTSAGTVLVSDINAGGGNSFPNKLITVGTTIYFQAYTGAYGTELWKTDGTSAGTVLVKDIYAGGSDSNPDNFVSIGSTLYFWADNGSKGLELWKSDGTDAGTKIVADINTSGDIDPDGYGNNMVVLGNALYFFAYDQTNGYQLWTSDGTFDGTRMVKLINPYGDAADWYDNGKLVVAGSNVFFNAYDDYDYALWKSDGTSAGTQLVDTDYEANYPTNITAVGSLVVFQAYDYGNTDAGNELFISDGTEAGTYLTADIYSGSSNSNPYGMINMNDQYIAYAAQDGFTGYELWKYTTPSVVNASSLGNVLCGGSAYNVTYTVTQGLLNSGNQFKVELSDGLGKFTSPTTLGTLTGTATTGTIPANVPNNVSGLGYRLRVSASDQASISTAIGLPYIVADAPVTISGNKAFCSGVPTTLTAAGAVSYLWSNSATGNTVSVSTAGALTVTSTDAYGCTNDSTITIVQDAAPTIAISGNTSYCIGGSTTITASGASTYMWNPSTGVSDPFAGTVTFNGSSSTTYTLTAMGAACSSTTAVNIIVSACNSGMGIEEFTNNGIQVYPNPTRESLFVQMDLTATTTATIKLVNVQGMLIYSETAAHTQGMYLKTIDMSKEAKGIYWLQVITNKGTITNKIVVE